MFKRLIGMDESDSGNHKRFLFLGSALLKTGGIERYNQNLLRSIIKFCQSMKILIMSDTKKKFSDIPIRSYGHFKHSIFRKVAFSMRFFREVFFFNPNIIICGHVNFSLLCYIVSLFPRKRYVVIVYGIDVWHINTRAKRKALGKAHLIISISNFTKNKITEQVPELKNKVQLLPPAIDGAIFFPKPKPVYLIKRYGLESKKVILTICRLDKSEGYKGYDKVIEALPKIIKKIPNLVYLIGGKGNDAPRIKRLIKGRGLDDYVKLIGLIPEKELVDHYNLCDIFVMPSKGEGFGIVFLEAVACGKPVICGNKDGSVDAVLNGKLGILVDPDNIDQIADAIINVLQGNVPNHLLDPSYLRKTVLEHYGSDKFTKRVKGLLKRVKDEL